MAYVVKRYANRKLYDTRTKRYLTLEEVAVLVRSGEDVRVEDADSGEDLTGQVLTKIIADENRKGGAMLVPPKILVDLIQRPGEAVFDAVRNSVNAGQRTVGQVSGEVGRIFEERLRVVMADLGIPSRAEFEGLVARVEALEKSIPSGRFGTAEEVASCIAFLLSERSRWVVGHCLVVDGGQFPGIS